MSNGIKPKPTSDKFFTIEFFGVTVILSSFLLLVSLVFGKNVLFEIGYEVQSFLLGVFGYFSYPLFIATMLIGFAMLFGKSPNAKLSTKTIVSLSLYLVITLCILTVLTSTFNPGTFGEYLAYAYNAGRGGLATAVAGGVLFSIIVYLPAKYLTVVGALIIFLLAAVGLSFYLYKTRAKSTQETATQPAGEQAEVVKPQEQVPNGQQPQYVQPQQGYASQPQFVQPPQPQYVQGVQQQPAFYQQNPYQGAIYPTQDMPYFNPSNPSSVYTDRELHDRNMQILYPGSNSYQTAFNQNPNVNAGVSGVNIQSPAQPTIQPEVTPSQIAREVPPVYERPSVVTEQIDSQFDEFDYDSSSQPNSEVVISEPIAQERVVPPFIEKPQVVEPEIDVEPEIVDDYVDDFDDENIDSEEIYEEETEEVVEPDVLDDEFARHLIENMPKNYKYNKPPLSLFKTIDNSANNFNYEVFKAETIAKILTTLKTFGVDTKIAAVYRGPAVTRFDIEIPPDVPMVKVTKQYNDINLRIAAKSAVRMIAPVPNTSYIGIEVPNSVPDSVAIKDILVSDGFMENKPSSLIFALGKDVIGRPVSLDLADMPHMLVTGTTGSGKSVCLNSLVISLISKYGPDELRFVIVDPKRVDLEPFKVIPHMMFGDIIEDVPTTNAMLGWAVEEMERRYKQLAEYRVKNIKDYNAKARANGDRIMHRIVIIMDEFADIMLQDKKGVAVKVCLIAQKARAAGIHLVLAAQRPSVDVVEGPIKSNLPTRIVFRASALADSMVSLGEAGAEKLLGRGDCLYRTGGMLNVERVMGAYVSDDEMYAIIDYVSDNNEKYYDYNNWAKIKASVTPQTPDASNASSNDSSATSGDEYVDPLCIKAMRIGFDNDGLSVSLLQRRLAVGYPRAGKIIDWLEANGYITAELFKGKRKMMITQETFEERFGEN